MGRVEGDIGEEGVAHPMTKRTHKFSIKTHQGMTDSPTTAQKLQYLSLLPEHRLTSSGYRGDTYDVGTLRPWGPESREYLRDCIEAGMAPLDIAFESRRDYETVLWNCRILKGLME